MSPSGVAVYVVIEASVLAPQALQHRLVRLSGGSLTHTTSVPYSSDFQLTDRAAYDKSMVKSNGTRPVRWLLWLAAGMLFGVVLGFGFGLARPRARK